MLEKMKLADLAALDGAISNVRLWRIGDLDHKIIPTKAAINKLRDILASNVGGGTMDLVWGPEIDFKELCRKQRGYDPMSPMLFFLLLATSSEVTTNSDKIRAF